MVNRAPIRSSNAPHVREGLFCVSYYYAQYR